MRPDWPALFRLRIEKVQAGLAAAGFAALVATKPQSVFYLSDFNQILNGMPAVVVVPADGAPVLLVWSIRLAHARAEAMVQDIRTFGVWGQAKPIAETVEGGVAEVLRELGLDRDRIATESDSLSVGSLLRYKELLPDARFEDGGHICDRSRLVKDAEEMARIGVAAAIANKGMTAAKAAVAVGRTEADISSAAESEMRGIWTSEFPDRETAGFASPEGATWSGLWCMVLSGERLSMEADTPKGRVLKTDDVVMIQIWATCDGYLAENERVVCLGHDGPAFSVLAATLEAQRVAMSLMRAGTPCSTVYKGAVEILTANGHGQHLPGRIGHSIGLGLHEPMSLGPREKTVLEPGMVVTVEPGIAYRGGHILQSDTVAITSEGVTVLTEG
jgi:Xaa-Pro dipeptidase